ncbi:calcineurin B homologous protein 1-like [Symsagittifera roscoffensis]|uniref:calcineurin B homologous protein 1-like n=1 Tax=Symsagittifera roscoffensis TaxID=84072 RepID=UPI00307B81EE
MGNLISYCDDKSDLKFRDEDNALAAKWQMSEKKVSLLRKRFNSIDREAKGFSTRGDLLSVKGLVLNPFIDRIVEIFFQKADRKEGEEKLYFSQFLETVLIFRPVKERDVNNPDKVNSRINKVRFAYRMYDLDNDGSISKDEILGVLVMMVGPHVDKEQLEEIAERAMREVDDDADNTMSFEEYAKIMERVAVEEKMSIKFLE